MMLVWMKCGIVVWVLSVLLHLASCTSPTHPPLNPPPDEDGMIRLPKTLRPIHYEVRLQAFLGGNFSIHGQVKVEVKALLNTRRIFLHMTDIITFNETAKVVDQLSGQEHRILQQSYNAVRSVYVVEVEEELREGHNYSFSVSFVGTLGQHPRGFYRSKYTKENGEERWVAATQFQATDARRAFPCMDEPALKATFSVFLARRGDMLALSNMPLRASTPIEGQEGWYWDEFERSVAMSTYLVAFAITDFPIKVVAGEDGSSTLIRALARASVGDQLEYGTRMAALGLQVFEKYFDVAFPLPKIDLICPPEMSPNAMENWGLITFRESGLLYDPAQFSVTRKVWVCYLVAHELAHQWFGNLVTLAWWTDLWLNEGFATYLADVAVDQMEPTWGMLDMFVVDRLQSVMVQDALSSSHPISRPVHDPATINEIFDTISYFKGASVIRMMNQFLTEATFRRGLTEYLTTLQYGSAEQDDLWGFLTRVGHRSGTLPEHLTVKTIMDTWTLQMGFPVITVRRTTNTTATVTQEYFSLEHPSSSVDPPSSPSSDSSSSHDTSSSPQEPSSSNYSTLSFPDSQSSPPESSSSSSYSSSSSSSASHDSPSFSSSSSYDSPFTSSYSPRWWVPLTYTTQERPDFSDTSLKLWLSGDEPEGATTEIQYPEPGQWVVFNIRQTGYYRVNYDDENWALLTRQLEEDHTVIHVSNRAQIIDDAFNMAKAGRLSYHVALGLTGYLQKEREYVAWRAALDNLQHIYYMMNRDAAYGALKNYLLSLLLPVYRSLGGLVGGEAAGGEGEGEGTVPDQLLKAEVVWWVCRLNHPECVMPAIALYRSWMARPEEIRSVSVNVFDAVSCTAVREGGEKEWLFAWRRRKELGNALACAQKIWILNRYLDGAFNSSSGIRRQDAPNTFRSVAREPLGALVAWDYLRTHWTRISQYIGTTFFALPRMIEDVTRSFTTTLQLQELEEFERRHKPDGGLVTAGGAVAQAVEATRVNVAWVQLHRQEIIDLLASKGFSSDLASLSE